MGYQHVQGNRLLQYVVGNAPWVRPWIGLLLFASIALPTEIKADEYSIIQSSTVLGRNFGVPYPLAFGNERQPGDLTLVTENLFLAKNLELTGSSRIDGETFFGVLSPTRINYLAAENVQFEIGGYLGRNYGDDQSLDIAEPLARLIYQPRAGEFIVAGSLIQTHWAHDAIRDDVNLFRQGSETGLQYRSDLLRLKTDYWIDWRIRETAERSEQFDGGGTNQLRLGPLWLDGQFFWSHTGGQLNSQGAVTNSSGGMLGCSLGWTPPDWEHDVARAGVSFLASHFESRTSPKSTGSGIEYWVNVELPLSDEHLVLLFAKHFEGDQFFTQLGDPLYRFDQYSQVGFDWVVQVNGGLQLETGFVGQFADDTFMNTYQINLVWQGFFRLANKSALSNRIIYSSLPDAAGESDLSTATQLDSLNPIE